MTSGSLQNYRILPSIWSMNHDLQNPYHDKDHHPHCYLFPCISHLIIGVVILLNKTRDDDSPGNYIADWHSQKFLHNLIHIPAFGIQINDGSPHKNIFSLNLKIMSWSEALRRKKCCFSRKSFPLSVTSPGHRTTQICWAQEWSCAGASYCPSLKLPICPELQHSAPLQHFSYYFGC